jgi:hypothetical protein
MPRALLLAEGFQEILHAAEEAVGLRAVFLGGYFLELLEQFALAPGQVLRGFHGHGRVTAVVLIFARGSDALAGERKTPGR